jgi:hypothetical protein
MSRRPIDLQPDLVADRKPAVALVLGSDRLAVAEVRVDQCSLAKPLDQVDLGLRAAAARNPHRFGADADPKLAALRHQRARHPRLDHRSVAELQSREFAFVLNQRSGHESHCRRADELRHEDVRRPAVDLHRRADLLDSAVAHDDDPVRERHRLGLVVGHHDHRGVDALLELRKLDPRTQAKRRVEVGKRLVEQEQVRLLDQRASDRDPLALATRHLRGLALQQRLDLEHPRRVGDPAVDFVRGNAGVPEAERHILARGHVRVERVMLEHHRDSALSRRKLVDPPSVEPHLAAVGAFEAGDDPQQSRLARTGRAEESDELALFES